MRLWLLKINATGIWNFIWTNRGFKALVNSAKFPMIVHLLMQLNWHIYISLYIGNYCTVAISEATPVIIHSQSTSYECIFICTTVHEYTVQSLVLYNKYGARYWINIERLNHAIFGMTINILAGKLCPFPYKKISVFRFMSLERSQITKVTSHTRLTYSSHTKVSHMRNCME